MKKFRIMRFAALILLVLSAYFGLTNGLNEIRDNPTTLKKSVGVTQVAYAIVALGTLAALWFRPAWAVRLAIAWAALVTATAILAALAWPSTLGSALAAAGFTAVLGAALVLLIRQGVEHGQ
ncbi:MAG: hypothetical protein ACRERX_21610 [Pseudomonas sp.]